MPRWQGNAPPRGVAPRASWAQMATPPLPGDPERAALPADSFERSGAARVARRDLLLGMGTAWALQSCQSSPSASPAEPRAADQAAIDAFVADCVAASTDADPQAAVREVLARGVREPRKMLVAVGE